MKREKNMQFKESETIEFKRIATDDIKKEIIAFANTKGGKIYIGVDDDGSPIGLKDPDDTALQVSNMARDAIKPDISMFLHYETISMEGKEILSIDVQRGTERPYYIAKKGIRPEGVYVRQGYSSVPATDNAIRQMIKETDGEHFEDMRSLEQNLKFKAAEEEFEKRGIPFGSSQMKTLGLLNKDGLYTNLALILSDECKHTIKVAVFENERKLKFKDRKEFEGSVFTQMNEAFKYIDLCNRTSSTFEGLYRIDSKDYPPEAIREALLNCIVHREYSIQASTLISIYSNKIEFVSVGGLAPEISLEDLDLGVSVCRNPKLANVFYRLELIEAYGTGIRRIMESYEDCACKPTIETTPNAFKTTLPNMNEWNELSYLKEVAERYEPYNRKTKGISNTKNKILAFMKEHGAITRKDLEKLTGASQASCVRILNDLEESGYIKRQGKARSTYYILA